MGRFDHPWPLLAVVTGSLALVGFVVAPSGDVRADCNRQCPPGAVRDAQGCCPGPAPGPPKSTPSAAPEKPATAAVACAGGMVRLPAGSFTGPFQNRIDVAPYCLDLTEVTTDAYTACVSANACTEPAGAFAPNAHPFVRSCNWKRPGAALHPINCVDWSQATAYCGWAKKRLPTDVELVWASRNGDQGTSYPWGNAPPNASFLNACGAECVVWAKTQISADWAALYAGDDAYATTAPVGSFAAGKNRWGIVDLAGNVSEWTSINAGPTNRAVQGGSWSSTTPGEVQARFSGQSNPPSAAGPAVGFRCAKD